jgi:hypothetical protein
MGAFSSTGNPSPESLALLLRVYAVTCADAGAPCSVQFQPGDDNDGKVAGELASEEITLVTFVLKSSAIFLAQFKCFYWFSKCYHNFSI